VSRVLAKAISDMVMDHSELYKHFTQNPDFKRQLLDDIFGLTYRRNPSL
jgi:type I restriction enzyme, R subunit